MEIKKYKTIVFTVFVTALMMLVINKPVMAYNISPSPIYTTNGPNCEVSFDFGGPIAGKGEIVMYANLYQYDLIQMEHCIHTGYCANCGEPYIDYGTYFNIKVDCIDHAYTSNLHHADKNYPQDYDAYTFDFAGYALNDTTNKITLQYDMGAQNCIMCYTPRPAQLYIKKLTFIDKRGDATFQQPEYTVTPGGTITISPTFNQIAYTTEWAVRYNGEAVFTPLTEGENRDGLIATGVDKRTITLSNVPYIPGGFDLGVFAYDSIGRLPGFTQFPYTDYYTHISSPDYNAPTVSIDKVKNADGKSVTVSINAQDAESLHAKPYSWDGGNTFSEQSSKSISKVGTYQVAVRDAAGNITRTSFYVDSNDLKGSTQAAGTESSGGSQESVDDRSPATGSGSSSGSSGTGGTSGSSGSGGTSGSGTVGGSTGNTQAAGSGKGSAPDNNNTGSGSMNSVKTGTDREVLNTGGTVSQTGSSTNGTSGAGSKEVTSITDKNASKASGSRGSSSESGTDKNTLKASDISKDKSDEVFDRIRNNSKDYIIAMHDNYTEEEMGSAGDDGSLNVESLEKDGDGSNAADAAGAESLSEELKSYRDSGNADNASYKPSPIKDSPIFVPLLILLGLLLIAILTYVLFFGVIIFAEKETELSKISKSAGVKVPVAVSHISYSDGRFSICFRELLSKHKVLYARPGVLFVYMYDGEKISIVTKFRGDKKREIAVENVRSEIKVGSR